MCGRRQKVLRPDRDPTAEARSPPARSACFSHPVQMSQRGVRAAALGLTNFASRPRSLDRRRSASERRSRVEHRLEAAARGHELHDARPLRGRGLARVAEPSAPLPPASRVDGGQPRARATRTRPPGDHRLAPPQPGTTSAQHHHSPAPPQPCTTTALHHHIPPPPQPFTTLQPSTTSAPGQGLLRE